MPVTTTTNVVHSLESVTINLGGSVTVTIKTVITGAPDSLKVVTLSAEQLATHWTEFADPSKNRWNDLCDLLYQLLIDGGHIAGTIS